ncbi:unnamed protein product, partial [Strongylus vulgaris]
EAIVGVNLTNIIGNATNCLKFDENGYCLESTNYSVAVAGIRYDKLYGITFCAVKDPRNITIPDLTRASRAFKPRADKVFIRTIPDHVDIFIGIAVGAANLLVLVTIIICCHMTRKQKKENKLYQLKLAQHDIWEIDRRNLIIHEEMKLGSGAFGTVYRGNLLGNSVTEKHPTSPLGVNLMRAKNCQVAVKMLPECADDVSRGEFLREIRLMKTLGYHERQ